MCGGENMSDQAPLNDKNHYKKKFEKNLNNSFKSEQLKF